MNIVLRKGQTALPDIINPDKDMTHCFNFFFCQTIPNIHHGFVSSTLSQGMSFVEESCISMLGTLEPFTETDIRQLLKRSSNAFYAVDPLPTSVHGLREIVSKAALVKGTIRYKK